MIKKITQRFIKYFCEQLMGNYFSVQSSHYARIRPTYPDELFAFLSSLCSLHETAWDCATGNGQAAISLSKYFQKVIATDVSNEQISRAFQRENVYYSVERVEHSAMENGSVDLITVATAIHWFNIPEFYKEVHRVLRPGGILAVWGYAGCNIDSKLDFILDDFAFNMLKNYWRPETKLNWQDKYETINFPYKLIDAPKFKARAKYNFNDLVHYLNSWSAIQKYKDDNNSNPVDLILPKLENLWGDKEEIKEVSWNLFLKCGRKQIQ